MKWRIFDRRPPQITASEAARRLSARAHELRRAERARQVKAHCQSILDSMKPKEPTT